MVRFVLSCSPFSGFRVDIPKDSLLSLEKAIGMVKTELMRILREHHLEELIDLLVSKEFHIHDYTLLDVLSNEEENRSWYICSHCPSSSIP